MESIISLCIVFGLPIIFLILFLKNIIRVLKSIKDKVPVKKSSIIKSVIFGGAFISIVIGYIWIMYLLSNAVVNM